MLKEVQDIYHWTALCAYLANKGECKVYCGTAVYLLPKLIADYWSLLTSL